MGFSATAPAEIKVAQARCRMTAWQRRCKRTLDIIGSSLILVVFAPVMAVIALCIKLGDGGPIIHRRRVVGCKGEFNAFKLRSMRVDADEILQRDSSLRAEFAKNFKLENDPRVTPVGRVIRGLSLDELPQLMNVLRGEMSLVGPRMIAPEELERFGDARWVFQQMKPGLTGYWQIYGRQEVSYKERVEMEVFYAQNWSLLLDLKLLMETPLRVLRGTGAY